MMVGCVDGLELGDEVGGYGVAKGGVDVEVGKVDGVPGVTGTITVGTVLSTGKTLMVVYAVAPPVGVVHPKASRQRNLSVPPRHKSGWMQT
ncbi:hypothetical protein L1987_54318 [Smallanthus sonchifolius]|uniref:Uncharacterized protein n=1 Tax=Smallanthus sonchifolius TaxID=185202 RepID=A0ACB9E7F8_9ASTR|nr:hypothetical protein L1987_54318 [Smallanthus sonchifolius]